MSAALSFSASVAAFSRGSGPGEVSVPEGQPPSADTVAISNGALTLLFGSPERDARRPAASALCARSGASKGGSCNTPLHEYENERQSIWAQKSSTSGLTA